MTAYLLFLATVLASPALARRGSPVHDAVSASMARWTQRARVLAALPPISQIASGGETKEPKDAETKDDGEGMGGMDGGNSAKSDPRPPAIPSKWSALAHLQQFQHGKPVVGPVSFTTMRMASDAVLKRSLTMTGNKFAWAPASFVGTSKEWVNMTQFVTATFLGIDLNGQTLDGGHQEVFHDMFQWLAGANYGGTAKGPSGATLNRWHLDVPSYHVSFDVRFTAVLHPTPEPPTPSHAASHTPKSYPPPRAQCLCPTRAGKRVVPPNLAPCSPQTQTSPNLAPCSPQTQTSTTAPCDERRCPSRI